MEEFFYMGGYGVYVWSSYAIWLAVMIINVVQPAIKARGTIKRLARALNQGATPR
ncbi:MAG: heme exporter protein CcmD [Gammaproteobacteria bacterium]|nr:heme exporter protein CcmD [Gammaproteobacteria bacterium]MDH3413490.1 heme exporter protein CcmD [Gammaproteobacteria bacterium]